MPNRRLLLDRLRHAVAATKRDGQGGALLFIDLDNFKTLNEDQSFVRDVLTDPNDAAIARTSLGLGHTLGLDVIAEGVETADQRNFLAMHGCRAFQGYLFGRPVTAEQF